MKDALSTVFGRRPEELVLADLETTDSAHALLLKHREALEGRAGWADIIVSVRAASQITISFGLDALREHLRDEVLLLHRGVSEYCGALEVLGGDVLDHSFDLVELDQEAVVAGSRTGASGVILEYLTDPIGVGTPTFKLLGWQGFASETPRAGDRARA